MDQTRKALAFQALHQQDKPFIIPNPWDAGTARMLAALGFAALATTSAGLAFSLGRRDAEGALSRDETLANAKSIVEASELPVAADLENGFGDAPEVVADTIRLAADIGLVGGSIEDASGNAARPIYDFNHSVERIAAAAEMARRLPFPFMLAARAENFLHGKPDLDDTIRRLQAYEAAGADVLFAPGLPDADAIRAVCSAVSKPVNVVMGLKGKHYSVTQLAELGVRRISLGSSLSRAALSGFMRAAQELVDSGTFSFANDILTFAEVNAMMQPGKQ
ncbi:oxaloacetate decarboxylase [Vogesella sp. LIG4]|uniref:isocitrate lyase/PEP mutase family protein n=1 Tax=Vogesella sp. LIG4 TaxID=1192162 RepID=UPI00081FCA3F|nr:isocitrate lyase/phosphoenolpyruvate mutase family protein [Vogesella sp. LIG4]SCK19162.1 2-Methylisocitrate lyase, PEP mutase family [Vogesella sp. LIG4]